MVVLREYTVYKHTSPNGKVYIGITRLNPIKRWQNGRGYRRNEYFMNAIIKYGWDNIKHEILFTNLTEKEAWQKEKELISLYQSNNRKYGYNIENGGNTIGKHSEYTKNKIKEKHHNVSKENNPMWNKEREDLKQYNIKVKSKEVFQYDLKGNYIASYYSTLEAYRQTGIRHISECAIGKCKTAGRLYMEL